MNLSNLFPALRGADDDVDTSAVGTVEKPFEAHALTHVPTGKAAQQSIQDRYRNLTKDPERYAETALPINARAQRRAQAAGQRRQAKKGRRSFVNRQWAQEREANQLAQLFNIVDGLVPGDRDRAGEAVAARVDYLFLEKVKADPNTEVTVEQIEQRLRGPAKTARTVEPKAARRRRALDEFFERELVGHSRSEVGPLVDRIETLGRTGRAG